MENRNIIIILLIIIVVLAAAIGIVLFNQSHEKQASKIKITSDEEQYEGGKISIKLTDLNKTPISDEIVNVTITNKKGKVVVDDVVKTNSKGKAKLNLDLKKGKYTVNVTYGGNENYTGDNASQKLKIKEEVQAVQSSNDNSNYNEPQQTDYNSPNSDYYRSEVDGSYHKKEPGVNYIYTQDAYTGEWSYWIDKS